MENISIPLERRMHMDIYNQLRQSSLETDCLGLSVGAQVSGNVFTPIGGKVIGWGDNGLHFCQVSSIGQTVFCIDPAAAHGEQIQPVASDLREFLRLMISTGGTEPIANAYRWSRSRFDAFIASNSLSLKQQSVVRALKNIYHIDEIADPFRTIRSLQADFDYSALPLHPDFDEHSSLRPGGFRWEVHYGESFCRTHKGEKEAKVIPCGVSFQRGTGNWSIPAIYDCQKGFVIDCCVQIPNNAVRAFIEKWQPRENSLSAEEEKFLELENPMSLHCIPSLSIDGKQILPDRSQQRVYIPWTDHPSDVRRTVMHYSLDEECSWVLYRIHFPQKGKKKKSPLRSMVLSIEASEQIIPGAHITDPAVGDSFQLIHPKTEQVHTLTVTEYSREQLDPNFLINPPGHYVQLCCTLSPELDASEFTLQDCAQNDAFQPIPGEKADGSTAIGIIGGSDGPTSVILSNPKIKGQHCFFSAFHYTPVDSITWQAEYHCKLLDPIAVPLLGGNKK